MELTQDEIIQILKYIEESSFNELHLETGELKLIIIKRGKLFVPSEVKPPKVPTELMGFNVPVPDIKEQVAKSKAEMAKPEVTTALKEGLIPIKASMLGTFYRCPAPEAPPYVEVGTFVKEDDTVCMIEVMKVFSAVKAGVRGYIEEICAESGQFIEYGQIIFLVRPDQGSNNRKT